LEAGVGMTSYIPTTTVAVTRAAETATMAMSSSAGATIALEAISSQATPAGANSYWLSLDDGTVNNRISIMTPASSIDVDAFANSNAVTSVNQLNHFTTIPSTPFRYAIALNNAVSYASCANGGTVDALASATYLMPLNVSRLAIGTGGTIPPNAWIRRVRYWPRALSNFELQQATS
jgi:hypothetical protein